MAQDDGKKEDEKFEFTPEGEALGYITLEQARLQAIQHARDNTGFYGPRYARVTLVWEVTSQEEGEDFYDIRLSFRPAGRFLGEPGVEQLIIDKTGNVQLRQILDEPSDLGRPTGRGPRRLLVAAVGLVVIGVAAVGALFGSGIIGGDPAPTSTPVPAAALAPTPTTATVVEEAAVVTPPPTGTPVVVVREVLVTATPGPATPPPTSPTPLAVRVAATPVPTARPTRTPAPAMQVKRGGIVPMHAYAPPVTAPLIATTYSHLQNLSPLYNGLLIYDPETDDPDDIICDICTSWEISDDGRTFVYSLRPEANWSDGAPITSEDVVFTLESIVDPGQFGELWAGQDGRPHTGLIKPYYESSREIDLKTVEVNLQFPAGSWHPTIALQGMKIAPKHIILGQGKMQGLANPEDMVTSGPFRHVEYVDGVFNEYVRNPDYFKESKPYIDCMVQYIIVDVGTIIAAFATKQVLMSVGNVDNLGSVESKQFLDDYGDRFNVYFVGPAGAYHLMFNSEKKPFDDPRVRRAINLAIKRQEIIELFSVGDYTLSLPFPPGTWYGRTLREAEQVPGFRLLNGEKHPDDIAEAKRLMADSGFPDGFKTSITVRQVVQYVDVGMVIAQQLEQFLGIKSEIIVMDSGAEAAAYGTGDYEYAVQASALSFNDPDAAFGGRWIDGSLLGDSWARGRNTTTSAEIQDIFARQTREQNVESRKFLIRRASDLILLDAPLAGIYWTTSTFNIHKKIQNWHPHPSLWASSMVHEHIWCDPAC